MSNPYAPEAPAPRRSGGLTGALGRLFMKQAGIVGAHDLGGGFHVIELVSPQFRGVDWSPGQKVQIGVGPGFSYRTYTPIEWDAGRGLTRIIAYAHGDGPGSDWVRTVKAGDSCEVFGPRASLAVGSLKPPIILFGDETSLGLAAAIRLQGASQELSCVFEVNSAAAVHAALDLDSFGIHGAQLFERRRDDAHLAEIAAALLSASGASVILTGKATSIQRLRTALLRGGVPRSRLLTKAYWAPGKKGLD
jgi:NADPH-dependent ferric siderophore reductase